MKDKINTAVAGFTLESGGKGIFMAGKDVADINLVGLFEDLCLFLAGRCSIYLYCCLVLSRTRREHGVSYLGADELCDLDGGLTDGSGCRMDQDRLGILIRLGIKFT